MEFSLYTSLDTLSPVSVPYSTRLSLTLSLSPNQYKASNVLKVAKTKEDVINAIDKAAKYPGNSIHDHDYHAWCVDEKLFVCNYSDATLVMSVEHPRLNLICQHSLHNSSKNGSLCVRINIIHIYKIW